MSMVCLVVLLTAWKWGSSSKSSPTVVKFSQKWTMTPELKGKVNFKPMNTGWGAHLPLETKGPD